MIPVSVASNDIAMPPTGDVMWDMLLGVVLILTFMGMCLAYLSYGLEDVYYWFAKRGASAVQRFRMYRR